MNPEARKSSGRRKPRLTTTGYGINIHQNDSDTRQVFILSGDGSGEWVPLDITSVDLSFKKPVTFTYYEYFPQADVNFSTVDWTTDWALDVLDYSALYEGWDENVEHYVHEITGSSDLTGRTFHGWNITLRGMSKSPEAIYPNRPYEFFVKMTPWDRGVYLEISVRQLQEDSALTTAPFELMQEEESAYGRLDPRNNSPAIFEILTKQKNFTISAIRSLTMTYTSRYMVSEKGAGFVSSWKVTAVDRLHKKNAWILSDDAKPKLLEHVKPAEPNLQANR